MDLWDDLNPLHWLNEVNKAIGSTTADILEFLGITNPAVDPDGIREIAKTWKALGDAVGDANFAVGRAVTGLALEGEVASAFFDRSAQVRTIAGNVEDALHKGHDELNKLADQAHELISQVGILAAQIAEFEVASLGLDVLTGGLATVGATLASGTRATRIVALFGEVEAAAVRAAKVIEDLVSEIGGMARILKALKSVAKMAAAGAGGALGWDALFHPGNLTDPGKVKDDLLLGGTGGVAFGLAGKAFFELMRGMGPLGPKFALAADGGPLGGLGDLTGKLGAKFDDLLGVMQARNKDWWDKLPQDVKDKISGNFKRGNDFNAENNPRYPYDEVAVMPSKGDPTGRPRVDSYDPGVDIVSRKDTQLADVQLSTAKEYISELVAKYSPGTEIRAQKYPELLGKSLDGQMVLEVPVQAGTVPEELLKYAALKKVIIRDVDGHVYAPPAKK